MNHAKLEQSDEIYNHFYANRTWFPHVRKDYIMRQIQKGGVIYEDGIIITYNRYKRKQRIGNSACAQKGDIILHQILNTNQGNGKASTVLNRFLQHVNSPVWLTVRSENTVARIFYEKNGFVQSGEINWMQGKINGVVYLKTI